MKNNKIAARIHDDIQKWFDTDHAQLMKTEVLWSKQLCSVFLTKRLFERFL